MEEKKKARIQIMEDGPYLVSGAVPISEKYILPKGEGYELAEGEPLPQKESYALCRCGKTKNPPFCDGAHQTCDFQGKEQASKAPYLERAKPFRGPGIDLLDDRRCAFVRFCHREGGTAWELTLASRDEATIREAITAASECTAGRLVARDKEGNLIEPSFDPEILVLQDPEKGVSAGIYVRGGVELIGADGLPYEVRNRVTLCRCGRSKNMPFCDASHVPYGYRDDGGNGAEE